MPEYFEIKIKGNLDPRWSDWFLGMSLEHLEGDETLLSGPLPDQAALHGILERIRDLNVNFPHVAALPESLNFIRPAGYFILIPGLLLWATAVILLLTAFSKGKLVTTGAYGVVRNPIYSSVTFFVLPAVALLTMTWVYFVPSVFLYLGVMIFIGKEEQQLTQAFGKEYEDYLVNVDRLVPLIRPGLRYVLSHARTGQQE